MEPFELKKALLVPLEALANSLDGRDKINAVGSIQAVKLCAMLNTLKPEKFEAMSAQQAQDTHDYLALVYHGLAEFFQQMGWEVF